MTDSFDSLGSPAFAGDLFLSVLQRALAAVEVFARYVADDAVFHVGHAPQVHGGDAAGGSEALEGRIVTAGHHVGGVEGVIRRRIVHHDIGVSAGRDAALAGIETCLLYTSDAADE